MEYYFNELNPTSFQRLLNTLLVTRFGADARVTPLIGKDGGRDFETAPDNPFIQFIVDSSPSPGGGPSNSLRKGRHLFQAKFHRTQDHRPTDLRAKVIGEFASEIKDKILPLRTKEQSTSFFLITNVPGSGDAISKVDQVRRNLLRDLEDFHADIWWKDQIVALLDLAPSVWSSFPELFAGRTTPVISEIASNATRLLSRSVRLAIRHQFSKDEVVKFRQIDLAKDLSKLFVDLDVDLDPFLRGYAEWNPGSDIDRQLTLGIRLPRYSPEASTISRPSALAILLEETGQFKKIILEGGPGQGKSTLTQMATQIFRQQLLGEQDLSPDGRWKNPTKVRLPLRVELRQYAEQLSRDSSLSIEKYLADLLAQDSGGSVINVGDIHTTVENSAVLLVLDGVDEVGSDELRDLALARLGEIIERFEKDLNVDLKVILTSRPPAIAGRQSRLPHFTRIPLAPMSTERVNEYVQRWLNVQMQDEKERERVKTIFNSRRHEPHVEALIKNPMQLSVLLHFIYLKDDAFPSRRADLYQEYFKIVIDRDVEKSPDFRREREIVEGIHRFIGFRIHALTEAKLADGSLSRDKLLSEVGSWLYERGDDGQKAYQLFRLGEERLGLITILRGEGNSARYGFEIQPIREYFAAEHINQSMPVDAHSLFERMVRRPFWREVALFLAGLRRENEKADLVARARQLDTDPNLGWKQDGRDIILQLAKEGALSQPRHVLHEALDFVLDLLDPEAVPIQHEPRDLTLVMQTLVRNEGADRHKKRLISLWDRYLSHEDDYLLARIAKVSSGALSMVDIGERILKFSSRYPERMAKMRLSLPYEMGNRLPYQQEDRRPWEGIPDIILARELWNAGIRWPDSRKLRAPARLHPLLLRLFAFIGDDHPFARPTARPAGTWAVWRLLTYLEALKAARGSARQTSLRPSGPRFAIQEMEDIDYSGLDQETSTDISELIGQMRSVVQVLTAVRAGGRKEKIETFLGTTGRLMRKPGIIGLIAARCARPMAGILLSHLGTPTSDKNSHAITVLGQANHLLGNARHPLRRGFLRTIVSDDGSFVAIADLVSRFLKGEENSPWITLIPLFTWDIREIYDRCGNLEQDHLARLIEFDVYTPLRGRPLRTSQMQRVLGIARRTDDEDVLAGIIISIMGSTFVRAAGRDLVLKLMTNGRYGEKLASLLFLTHSERSSRDLALLQQIAGAVISDTRMFKLSVVTAAAKFYAEHMESNFPPLTSAKGNIYELS